MDLKFEGVYVVRAYLKCITGLHIGGSKESFEIGGIDNAVLKTTIPLSLPDREIKEGMPYIPGSSLKGKIRNLLEWQYDLVGIKNDKGKIQDDIKSVKDGKPVDVAIVFGIRDSKETREVVAGPVRVKFFDAYPTKETIESWEENIGSGLYTEIKVENAIDRITSEANPRKQERVPAGSRFELEIVYSVFDKKDLERFKILFEGMKLLEDNYLGGGGTRGNGRIKFENIDIYYKSKDYYKGEADKISKGSFKSVDEILNSFSTIIS